MSILKSNQKLSGIKYSVVFFLLCNMANGQNLNVQWSETIGDVNAEGAQSITRDNANNIYVIGTYESQTITIGIQQFNNAGNSDIFLIKYDPSGNVIWAKTFGDIGFDFGRSIDADSAGFIYITGNHGSSQIVFDTIIVSGLSGSLFAAKLDTSGNVVWAKGFGNWCSTCYSHTIRSDNAGNVYFGITDITGSQRNIILLKLDNGGDTIWSHIPTGINEEELYDMTIDRSDNLIITGRYTSAFVEFSTAYTIYNNSNFPLNDVFVCKYDSTGNVLWAKSFGSYNDEIARSVTTDKLNNIYFSGAFSSNQLTIGSTILNNSGLLDIFYAKLDSTGAAIWAKSAGGTDLESTGCIRNAQNLLFITGYFRSNPINASGTLLPNFGTADVFLIIADTSGTVLDAEAFGGANQDVGVKLFVDNTQTISLCGFYESPSINFGSTTIFNNGSADGFLAQFSYSTSAENEFLTTKPITAGPNPVSGNIIYFNHFFKQAQVELTDMLGNRVFRRDNFSGNRIEFDRQPVNGLYLLKTIESGNTFVFKLVFNAQ